MYKQLLLLVGLPFLQEIMLCLKLRAVGLIDIQIDGKRELLGSLSLVYIRYHGD